MNKSPFLTTAKGILFADDCLNILPQIPKDSIDCVFADPPFNLGKNYNNEYDDEREHEEYIQWCFRWLKECCRILTPGGALFLYATPELNITFGGYLNKFLAFRHWVALTMKGTYRRGKRLYPAHYSLLYYTKGEPRVFNELRTPIPTCRHCRGEIPDYGGHRDKMNDEGVNLTDFWADTSPNRHKRYKVRKGVNELKLIIPERAILLSTNENDVVLDPFGGGGSTFQAAEKHNRNWIGVELYDCSHIEKRMKEGLFNSVNSDLNPILQKIIPVYENHRNKVL